MRIFQNFQNTILQVLHKINHIKINPIKRFFITFLFIYFFNNFTIIFSPYQKFLNKSNLFFVAFVWKKPLANYTKFVYFPTLRSQGRLIKSLTSSSFNIFFNCTLEWLHPVPTTSFIV